MRKLQGESELTMKGLETKGNFFFFPEAFPIELNVKRVLYEALENSIGNY